MKISMSGKLKRRKIHSNFIVLLIIERGRETTDLAF